MCQIVYSPVVFWHRSDLHVELRALHFLEFVVVCGLLHTVRVEHVVNAATFAFGLEECDCPACGAPLSSDYRRSAYGVL